MEYELILIRYGEMTLKKKNYKMFLQQVNSTILRKLQKYQKLTFSKTDYRFYIYLNGESYKDIIDVLNTIPGLGSYSLCKKVDSNYEKIAIMSASLLTQYKNSLNIDKKISFKVDTNRANKNFQATSIQISQEVSRRILPKVDFLRVDVHNPELTLNIDLRYEGTFIFITTLKGLGGYPSGTLGKGLLMISGGIDSCVAGYQVIKKGVELTAMHFYSPPHTSLNSLQKVVDLVSVLTKYTKTSQISLLVIPFTKIQEEIMKNCKNEYLVILMRRAMYEIASRICFEKNLNVIVNGESIGQVASQTLESINVVNQVTSIPIIRPLICLDKEEIVSISKFIKTYEISIKPYEDCCTVFVPEHPIIRPNIDLVLKEEAKYNKEELIDECCKNIEVITIEENKVHSVFKNDIF